MSTSYSALKRLYDRTKDILSPHSHTVPASEKLDSKEAPHPGTEGVSFEEALEKCPHLAKQYGKRGDQGEEGAPARSRCPYQDSASQEWPLRAVVLFIAYNIIATGVSMEIVRIAFVACAYHLGMLRISEFLVLYLSTASMSSYKLLGLLLMLTNKGGPEISPSDQYPRRVRDILYGVLVGAGSLAVTGVAMQCMSSMGYFKTETQSDNVLFSPVHHILIPIGSEFVYRGFLLKEMGKDLGAWFGVIGSSGWFGILQRGQASVKFAAFIQGLSWSLCVSCMKGNLVPVTVAHVFAASVRALYPALYFRFFPETP